MYRFGNRPLEYPASKQASQAWRPDWRNGCFACTLLHLVCAIIVSLGGHELLQISIVALPQIVKEGQLRQYCTVQFVSVGENIAT